MRFLFTVFITAVLVGGFALLYIYSGAYNVAATAPQGGTARWLLGTVMQKSVEVRARSIEPAPLDDKAMIARGGKFYGKNCESCHGGPGVVLSALGRGLRPAAPDLARVVRDWRPRELFWIVKNGIRMTGMPAWGLSHKDSELWPVVAFVSKLPTMTVDDYRAYTGKSGEGPALSKATGEDEAADRDDGARETTERETTQRETTPRETTERETTERAGKPAGAPAETDTAAGPAERSTPEGTARDDAKAEAEAKAEAQKAAPVGAAKDSATASAAKAAPTGAARDVENAEAATRNVKAEGAARDAATAETSEAADGKAAASPTAPTKQTAQAAPPRIRVHARPQQKPEPPRSSSRRQRR
jgi:mono/diheme cytochrome c family protein